MQCLEKSGLEMDVTNIATFVGKDETSVQSRIGRVGRISPPMLDPRTSSKNTTAHEKSPYT